MKGILAAASLSSSPVLALSTSNSPDYLENVLYLPLIVLEFGCFKALYMYYVLQIQLLPLTFFAWCAPLDKIVLYRRWKISDSYTMSVPKLITTFTCIQVPLQLQCGTLLAAAPEIFPAC